NSKSCLHMRFILQLSHSSNPITLPLFLSWVSDCWLQGTLSDFSPVEISFFTFLLTILTDHDTSLVNIIPLMPSQPSYRFPSSLRPLKATRLTQYATPLMPPHLAPPPCLCLATTLPQGDSIGVMA
uniref:Uncharacterized protein n=1 Tax=Lynx canadensis TaxID=61383 RepID=A0A667IF46_LYNCA